ncbi:hypothetical protein STURON_0074 [Spiroplasma turonicum]|uniref:Uncharacterized protein n=1 Tax=Spiroplasma turonicum TaxID=216946 RepID=A0A0K1P4T3_9MOLU|nr:hypothetical protein STURON_0074 [Spiroplasma turonicum]
MFQVATPIDAYQLTKNTNSQNEITGTNIVKNKLVLSAMIILLIAIVNVDKKPKMIPKKNW